MNWTIPWNEVLSPDHALEVVLRGTLAYLGLLFLLRIVMKRQSGQFSPSDVLLIVLIGDAIQNGMGGAYHSVTDGLLLVLTLVFWDFLVDWLAFRSPLFRRLISSPPLILIKNGQIQRRNMRREFVTDDELWGRLRVEGIDRLEDVKLACIESEGDISVIKRSQD